ncbi:hypothetical protein QJS04_geneDACA001932 [Acorus gramineus]|uniref:RCK N-terminal domain-containing protein n=1 Tax=Acorus gramineus TaxID=55184 RepID=A0AAV9AAF9_ACOGR|nr:hypothetical protein QJS04_geneDACA001932 [Acorus gramineus]
MDFACSLPRANAFSHRLRPDLSSRRGSFGNSRVFYRPWTPKRASRVAGISSCVSLRPLRALVPLRCQTNDSVAFIKGNNHNLDFSGTNSGEGSSSSSSIDGSGAGPPSDAEGKGSAGEEAETPQLEDLRELLEKAMKELEVARLNSTMFEERAQSISEAAIAMKDEAMSAWNDVNSILSAVQEMVGEEDHAKEAVQKATMAFSMAEARLQLAVEALDAVKEAALEDSTWSGEEEEEAVLVARDEIQECRDCLMNCEAELRRVQNRKAELQKEVDRLTVIAEKSQLDASRAEEEVANIMVLAEQAMAYELEATKHVNDAEIALQKVEKMSFSVDAPIALASEEPVLIDETSAVDEISQGAGPGISIGRDEEVLAADAVPGFSDHIPDVEEQYVEGMKPLNEFTDQENVKLGVDSVKETEVEVERSKSTFQAKKQDLTKESAPQSSPKALLKKSSRFFSASFFSFDVDEEGSTQGSVFHGLVLNLRNLAPKLIFGAILLGMGAMFLNRTEKGAPLLQQPDIATGIEEVTLTAKPLVREIRRVPKRLKRLIEKLPHQELSVERLSSMKKYVFGLGSAQVLVTAVVIGVVAHYVSGLPGPAAIVVGNGLALSSTAVVLQVLQERGESTSRHGRATFSVLLFQDLAVVVLLILIPLISPNSSKGGVGFQAIAEALGIAAVKAIVAITAIIAGGRLAGLSMALGAFLAGLLLAETEFSLQVESDIAPYRGLLLGLFFMTVGMSIDPKLLMSNFPVVLGTLSVLIAGKTLIVALVGRIFGVSSIAAIRVGLLLAPGGEFAFVAFGEATNQGIMSSQLSSLLFLVVGLSMALTPYIAAGGQLLASRFEQHDVRSLLPVESETDDLQDHIILCGFGRVGQVMLLLDNHIKSDSLVSPCNLSDRVAVGRALDLPVYFGDAGSREVLHKVGAERACAAAITLDTPGANYRTVWALSKYFPNVKTFVRAHDVDHGLNLEKAGATAVVPETLEPSLQLAAAVLAQVKLPTSEIAATINEFRSRHLSELTELCQASGSSLGYGFSRVMSKPKSSSHSDSEDDQIIEGTLAI